MPVIVRPATSDEDRARVTAILDSRGMRPVARLVDAVVSAARDAGSRRLWLVTTNDNVDALRFYQRRGFRLAELRAGAVDRGRATLKPSIPAIGDHGIPIRDELVLERSL